jgi:hypothetical protein
VELDANAEDEDTLAEDKLAEVVLDPDEALYFFVGLLLNRSAQGWDSGEGVGFLLMLMWMYRSQRGRERLCGQR